MDVVILAAGQGTRMRSARPKVLHPVAGQPMILRVLDLAAAAGATAPLVVLGHQADQVRRALPDGIRSVVQQPQLGTGHAVGVGLSALAEGQTGDILLVLYGDSPLWRAGTLGALAKQPVRSEAPIALLTARLADPTGYGRIRRSSTGGVEQIVEDAEATPTERGIAEVNTGVLLAWIPWLRDALTQLPRRPKGEYYLTDLVGLARGAGCQVLSVGTDDAAEVQGVNDQRQLALANAVLWQRKREDLMAEGVSILDPHSTYVELGVSVAPDVVLHPGCHLRGTTRIATGCEIGPSSDITDSDIGERTRVWHSVLEGARVGRDVHIGPFSHLRPGALIDDGAQLGNYAEVKASHIGAHTQMHHFSYVGDADLGERVNVGAGTITANYDGQQKHRTIVGDGAFIGSASVLRAPVEMGAGASTGAGAIVTHDIPPGEVWTGVPARPHRPRLSGPAEAGPPGPASGIDES